MPQLHSHSDVEQYVRRFGHPGGPAAAQTLITPPHGGDGLPAEHCCHCGIEVPATNPMAHAVAMLEGIGSIRDGSLLRLEVFHCEQCLASDACSPRSTTPGSGFTRGEPGGWCEPLSREPERDRSVLLTSMLLPMPPSLLAQLDRGLRRSVERLRELIWRTVTMSQGQAAANAQGPVTSLLFPGNSVAGNGLNGALIRILTGAAEASANAAEVGTVLVSAPLANPAFSAPSGFPATLTALTIANSTILATGTAAHARIVEAADSFGLSTTLRRLACSIGTSGTDIVGNTMAFVLNGAFSTTALSIQMP